MCTGDFYEPEGISLNGKARPPAGIRCIEPCIKQSGRWGSSFCNVEGNNWGAGCVPCSGKRIIP